MSRKYSGYDEDDYWDEEEDEDWYDDDDDYDEYDDVPQQKAKGAGQGSKGGAPAAGRGKAQGKAPAGASALAHYLCDPVPRLPNGKPQKAPKQPAKPPPQAKAAPPQQQQQQAFKFDTPSPDDIVMEANTGRKIGSSQGAAGAAAEAPSSELQAMKVTSQEAGSTRPSRPMSQYAMDAKLASACAEAAAAERAEAGGRSGLHLVVLGHVDAGKSTLMGRLLHDLGLVDQRTVHKHEKEAAQAGKASFSWAWLLDERPEERARGVTVDVAVSGFQTPAFNVTLLDAPGHRDFIPNMITGAAQADAALLLIDGSVGGFESGFEGNGQTREHARLARSLGVEQIAVVVSKLDTCDFSPERFLQIQEALAPFLRTCGFKDSSIQWLPAVGPSGENLVKPPQDPRLASWWDGSTLVGAIDKFEPRSRDIDRPLRLPVSESSKSRALKGDSVAGKVSAGAAMTGMQVMVQPGGQVGTIKAIEVGGKPAKVARAGDNATIGISGIDPAALLPGVSVLCLPDWPCHVATKLEAKVAILDVDVPVLSGQPASVHLHVSMEEAHVTRLVSLIDPKTGEVKKAKPRCLLKGQTGVVEVEVPRGICAEAYADVRPLGRITLRDRGKTFGIGIVEKIIC